MDRPDRSDDGGDPLRRGTVLRLAVVGVVIGGLIVLAWQWRGETDAGRFDLRNARAFIQDNVWTSGDATYAVWTDPDGRPHIGRREGSGSWTTTPLDAIPGNPLAAPTVADHHNVYVVAVDADGHVHVAGNMHGDHLRYVRSVEPGRIDGWEAATMGGGDDRSVTYPRFVGLPDGTLLFFRREGRSGRGDILLDRLPPGADQWVHDGTLIDGAASDESAYLHHVAVDPMTGALHLGWIWRDGRSTAGNNDVSYATSDDGGRTWTDTAGRTLVLPITHEQAEVVPVSGGPPLANSGGLVVDGDGRPHMVFSGRDELVHLWHDGTAWHQREPAATSPGSRAGLARAPDGGVWALVNRASRVTALQIHPQTGPSVGGPEVVFGWEPTIDSQALMRTGVVQMLVVDADADHPEIVALPLPAGSGGPRSLPG